MRNDLNDKKISIETIYGAHTEFKEDAYLPKIRRVNNKIFIETSRVLISPLSQSRYIKFLLINEFGDITNDSMYDYAHIQKQGYLVRLSIPKSNPIPEMLSIDYIIDINDIEMESIAGTNMYLFKSKSVEDISRDNDSIKLSSQVSTLFTTVDGRNRLYDDYMYNAFSLRDKVGYRER